METIKRMHEKEMKDKKLKKIIMILMILLAMTTVVYMAITNKIIDEMERTISLQQLEILQTQEELQEFKDLYASTSLSINDFMEAQIGINEILIDNMK